MIRFSTGPSNDPFSMYSTTNSVLQSRALRENLAAKKRASLDAPHNNSSSGNNNKSQTGYRRNENVYHEAKFPLPGISSHDPMNTIGIKKLIDPVDNDMDWYRVSVSHDSHKAGNSIAGESELRERIRNKKPLKIGNTFKNHGAVGNEIGFIAQKSYSLKEQLPVHGHVLRRMRREDPIAAENDGRGPAPNTTQSSVTHTRKSMQNYHNDDMLTPENLEESKRKSILFAGGFRENNNPEQLPRNQMDYISTYTAATRSHNDEKFMNSTRGNFLKPYIDRQDGAGTKTDVMQALKDKRKTRTGFLYSTGFIPSSEATGRTKIDADELLDDPTKMNASLLKHIKRRDPVEYNLMHTRDMYSTTSRGFLDDKSRQFPVKANARQVISSYKERQHTIDPRRRNEPSTATGYAVNTINVPVTHMTDDDILREGSIMRSSFKNPETASREIMSKKGIGQPIDANQYRYSRLRDPEQPPHLPSEYRKLGEPSRLTDMLRSDMDALETMHPSIQRIARVTDPAQYTEAVPSYQHKHRPKK